MDHPIIFSAPMIRALLDGRKTQTRRMLKARGLYETHPSGELVPIPPSAVGARLWVRESYYQIGHWEPAASKTRKLGKQKWRFVADSTEIRFEAPTEFRKGRHHQDPETSVWHKRLGRFMPRVASRLTLVIEGVKVERLQDISREDAIAEGLFRASSHIEEFWRWPPPLDAQLWLSPVEAYRSLWSIINGADSWDANPWVAAISFRVVKANIDALCEEAAL